MLTSLGKALTILDAFAPATPEWGLSELSATVGLPKPSVHHMLATLVHRGWVTQDGKTRRYRLGVRFWEKGWLAINQLGLREQARPVVEALARRTAETVHLAIVDALAPREVVYIDKIESAHAVRAYSMIGGRAPAYCVATGKAVLALRPDLLEAVIAGRLVPHTRRTLSQPARLRTDLEKTRKRGYSINAGEYRADVFGLAAPIRNHEGVVFAAVGISGPAYRLPGRVLRRLAPAVVAAAREISTGIGWLPAGDGHARSTHGAPRPA